MGLIVHNKAYTLTIKEAKHVVKVTKKGIKKGNKKGTHKKNKSRAKKNLPKSNEVTTSQEQRTVIPALNGAAGISNPKQMIALNNEKNRVSDSIHKVSFQNNNKEDNEGYFASFFASKNRAASFQTLEGTAAVFKSISGWDDKKFYVLTNLLPIGTIVRITTPDFKSICAKVINALPEVGNTVQYRLNDAAAAILGINNKTFPISVTY